MKKFLILIITSLIFVSPSYSAKINTDDLDLLKMDFSPTENPVAYNYFVSYANMLRSKIDFKKFHFSHLMEYRYKLHSEGFISDLKPMPLNTPYEGEKINKYIEDILLNNPPPPYPENMEIGDVYIEFSAMLDIKTETIIRPFRNNDGALYPGNHITIFLQEKSLRAILIDKIFY